MKILSKRILLQSLTWLKSTKPLASENTPARARAVFDCEPSHPERAICEVEPCDPDQCRDQPKVVIVGAGMAGLSAAGRLTQRGIKDVVVLEALERPGGRIHSCWLGDVVAELGSHWKHDAAVPPPTCLLQANEYFPRPCQQRPGGPFGRLLTDNAEFPTALHAYAIFRQIEEEAARIYCFGGHKQHGSLLHFVALRVQQELRNMPDAAQHEAARLMFSLAHALTARCGNDTALCADDAGCFVNLPGGEVRVPLGRVGILAPILKQIPDGAIRYCKRVTCMCWGTTQKSGYRANVRTDDGDEFPADYVILTVSMGVLRANGSKMFCPELPASKMDSMRCLGFGYCNKVYMEYCRPFWFWHKGDLNCKFCDNELVERCDWTRGITAVEMVPGSHHVLCAWVVGDEAAMMEALPDKDVAEGLTNVLRMSTRNDCIPYPTAILRSHWSTDPLFLGAYSFDCSNGDGEAQRALACPVPGPGEPAPPILFFAGEATMPGHYATVSGARLSGIREAERIVNLKRIYDGPPVPVEVQCDSKPQTKDRGIKLDVV